MSDELCRRRRVLTAAHRCQRPIDAPHEHSNVRDTDHLLEASGIGSLARDASSGEVWKMLGDPWTVDFQVVTVHWASVPTWQQKKREGGQRQLALARLSAAAARGERKDDRSPSINQPHANQWATSSHPQMIVITLSSGPYEREFHLRRVRRSLSSRTILIKPGRRTATVLRPAPTL